MTRRAPGWLGVFPLIFLTWTVIHYVRIGEVWTVLWLCDVCNLLLALGLFFGWNDTIWIATLWLWVGTPLWIMDDLAHDGIRLIGVFIHVVSGSIGLWAMRDRPRSRTVWPRALLLLVGSQAFCRVFAPAELNVNLAHAVYPPLRPVFGSYAAYYVFNLVSFGLALSALEHLLARWLPTRPPAPG